ncbi:MAG: hypothetical protein ACI4I8_08125 [Oscillospiraceae bacterium]
MEEPPDGVTPQRGAWKKETGGFQIARRPGEWDRRNGHPGRKLAAIGRMPIGYADGCVAGGKMPPVQINQMDSVRKSRVLPCFFFWKTICF